MRAAFVSTNSIAQGEQVGVLWGELLNKYHIKIHFAHRTFKWSNEARGMAAVHCVIIGFAPFDVIDKRIWDYEKPDSAAHELNAHNINPYLVDAPDVFLVNRSSPICAVPEMRYGSMPRDDGNLILTAEERQELLTETPEMASFVKLFLGAHELMQDGERYCLWLVGASPSLLNRSAIIRDRLKRVREFRLASKAASTRKFAETPSLFCQIAQPDGKYVLVPRHSSENRKFVPMGFFGQENVVADSCLSVPDAGLYHFGVMCSTMHNAWMRYTCGRLESRYRYSKDIVYNNYPWPELPSPHPSPAGGESEARGAQQRSAAEGEGKVEAAAQAVLDARAQFPQSTLADLYDPLTMSPALVKAHQALDRAVDACYRKAPFTNDAQRVEFLFERYQQLTSLLPAEKKKAKRKTKT